MNTFHGTNTVETAYDNNDCHSSTYSYNSDKVSVMHNFIEQYDFIIGLHLTEKLKRKVIMSKVINNKQSNVL